MPKFWTRLEGSDPVDRLREVREVVGNHAGVELVGNQIYYTGSTNFCFALLSAPEGFNPGPLLRQLRATHHKGLLDAGEKQNRKPLPPSSPQAPPWG